MTEPSENVEIERKFLVRARPDEAPVERQEIRQGYIARDGGNVVRIRRKGDAFILGVKADKGQNTRYELEYEVSEADAALLFRLCRGALIEKTRELHRHAGHVWEVDLFHGRNEGLIIAEVELHQAGETVQLPPWIGREVSGDARFFNAALSSRPFDGWGLSYGDLLAGA